MLLAGDGAGLGRDARHTLGTLSVPLIAMRNRGALKSPQNHCWSAGFATVLRPTDALGQGGVVSATEMAAVGANTCSVSTRPLRRTSSSRGPSPRVVPDQSAHPFMVQ